MSGAKFSVMQLCQSMAEQMKYQLEVGFSELIARRWLTSVPLSGPWPANMELQITPLFELLEDGLLRHIVEVRAAISLRGRAEELVSMEPDGSFLHLQNAGGWECQASLAFVSEPRKSDRAGNAESVMFAKVEGDITLPVAIRTRAPYDGP